MHLHNRSIIEAGLPLDTAKKVMILIHGRGANAASILGLKQYLALEDFALIAPEATQRTWYPYSFMAPVAQNEPSLSSALELIQELVVDLKAKGFKSEDIYFLGFSQGACLAGEFVARNATRYGGVFIYSGGLIGSDLDTSNYAGDFAGTPILLGCSDIDAHIPLQRVKDSTQVFKNMGASVTEQIFPNGAHTIFEEEITATNSILNQ